MNPFWRLINILIRDLISSAYEKASLIGAVWIHHTQHKLPAKQSVIEAQKCVKMSRSVMKLLPIAADAADIQYDIFHMLIIVCTDGWVDETGV